MADPVLLSIAEAEDLTLRAFLACGVRVEQAKPTAAALVAAERDGQKGHGLSRVSSYCAQVRAGKVKGDAEPKIRKVSNSACIVDAGHGFAYPAIDHGVDVLRGLAKSEAIAMAAITRSHHFGQAGAHVEKLAEAGLVAFLFGNSPAAMAYWGGSRPMMGTNPIAFAAPLPDEPPLVIDLALSVVARGRIMAAAKSGETIPDHWAFDAEGKSTTDPHAALEGSMAPMGDAKGAALALMVEVMAAAITGSNFGFEASSFLNDQGPPPDVGAVLIAIDPSMFSGEAYDQQMAVLAAAIRNEPGARMPGVRRLERRHAADKNGLSVPRPIYEELQTLAGAR